MTEHAPVLIVFVPLIAALAAPAVALLSPKVTKIWSFAALSATAALSVYALLRVLSDGTWHYEFGGWAAPWGIEYVLDPLSAGMAALVSLFAWVGAIYGWSWEEEESPLWVGAYQALYLLLTTGLLGIILTGDLFNLYVFLEIASLSAYALVASGGPNGVFAAFRYLIVGSVGALFWVLGIGYIYALTGTLNMADAASLWPAVAGSPSAVVAIALLVAGLAVKMAVFPMHGWQPDAYASAPAKVMPFLAGVMAKVSAYVMLRILFFVFPAAEQGGSVLDLLAVAGAVTVIAGSVLALRQTDVRRLLAYSSIGQIGYILIGFSIGSTLALTGALLHIVNHAVMKSCLFMATGNVSRRMGSTKIEAFRGLGARMPVTAGAFTLAALAMIGLPPACGFFSKWYLLRAAFESGAWPLAVVMLGSSLLSAVYFFRVIEEIYLKEPGPEAEGSSTPLSLLVPTVAFSAAIVLLGLFNQTVVAFVIEQAVSLPGI